MKEKKTCKRHEFAKFRGESINGGEIGWRRKARTVSAIMSSLIVLLSSSYGLSSHGCRLRLRVISVVASLRLRFYLLLLLQKPYPEMRNLPKNKTLPRLVGSRARPGPDPDPIFYEVLVIVFSLFFLIVFF